MFSFKSQEFNLVCDSCGNSHDLTIGWLVDNHQFLCSCEHYISIPKDRLSTELKMIWEQRKKAFSD